MTASTCNGLGSRVTEIGCALNVQDDASYKDNDYDDSEEDDDYDDGDDDGDDDDDEDYAGSVSAQASRKIRFTTPRVIEVLERAGISNRNAAMLFHALILDDHTKSNDANDYVLDYNAIRRARISFRRERAAQVVLIT